MKANEIEDGKVLMIGDLVIGCIETDTVGDATYKIPCKVTDINHYGDVICESLKSFPDELDWQDGDDFSWIEAIPLTAEILEKNGFPLDVEETNHPLYKGTEIKEYIISMPPNGYKEHLIWNGEYYIMFDSPKVRIDYVHQLQHALRLCGIDKEIVL